MIRFTLSAPPPSTNNLYVNARGRGRVKSAAYREWIATAMREIMAQRSTFAARIITGPWNLSIVVGRAEARRRDIDNMIKPVADLCVAMTLVDDDADMEGVAASWSRNPGVVVEIAAAPVATRRVA